MANPDRLTALDASFLHLEEAGDVHMHVASLLLLGGRAPSLDELVAAIAERLDHVPRYRQRLAPVPLGQGRPLWVDDPHLNLRYHVRHTALPAPGDDAALRRLAGRVFAQRLDRAKPLWELWLVEGLAPDAETGEPRFALLAKTHHALVDGVSGVDLASVLFDTAPDPEPAGRGASGWVPRPAPTDAQLLADALLERATVPGEVARGVRALTRGPMGLVAGAVGGVAGSAARALARQDLAPDSPYNVPIGPHRRVAWVDAELDALRAVKDALGGTVNDAALAVVARALGEHLRESGVRTAGLTLRALVPVSVRAEGRAPDATAVLGGGVAAMWVPLPVGVTDPLEVHAQVVAATAELTASGRAVSAQSLTELAGLASPTIMSQAARMQARARTFNVAVTNVPGPQQALYLLGQRLERVYPMVPLAANQALGVGLVSYAGRVGFGLLGDHDALPDLDRVAAHVELAVAELEHVAAHGGPPSGLFPKGRARRRPASRA